MLIGAGIIALFTVLILGGQEQELIFIDFEKEAKNVVVDKSRYLEIKKINKDYKALKKEYSKKNKSYAEAFNDLLSEQTTTIENFTHYLDEVIKNEEQVGEEYIVIREKVKGQMTEEEWNQMMDNLFKEIGKIENKTEKSLAKYKEQMGGFSQSILKSIESEETKLAMKKALENFTQKATLLAEKIVVYEENEIQVLSSYKSSKEDVSNVLRTHDSEMKAFYNLVFELHGELAKTTSESEWKKLVKNLQDI